MPYQFGTANDQYDLLDKLRLFLIANGWTVNMYADDASSYFTRSGSASTQGKRLHMSRNGKFINFRASTRATVYSQYNNTTNAYTVDGVSQYYSQHTGLAFYRSTGFDAAKSWDNQPGNASWSADTTKSMGAGCRLIGAVPSYRFFLVNEPFMLFIAVEYEVGKFRNLLLCDLQKYGLFEGGELHAGPTGMGTPNQTTYWDGVPLGENSPDSYGYEYAVRAVGLGASGINWCTGARLTFGNLVGLPLQNHTESSFLGKRDFDFSMLACSPSNYTGIVPLVPLRIARNFNGTEVQLLGEVPGLKVARSGYKTGDIITMGSDRWMIIPFQQALYAGFAVPYDGA